MHFFVFVFYWFPLDFRTCRLSDTAFCCCQYALPIATSLIVAFISYRLGKSNFLLELCRRKWNRLRVKAWEQNAWAYEPSNIPLFKEVWCIVWVGFSCLFFVSKVCKIAELWVKEILLNPSEVSKISLIF